MGGCTVTEVDTGVIFRGMEPLAKILRDYKKSREPDGWKRVAEGTGWDGETLRKWSTGETTPPADAIPVLSALTGRDLYELMGVPRPGGPVGLSEGESLLVETIRILGLDSRDVLRAIYSLPRPPIRPDPGLRQLSGYNLTPGAHDDLDEPAAERDDNHAGPARRPRKK